MMNTVLVLAAIGLCTGIFSGLVGTGGGLIMVPCFILFLGLGQHQAQGLSLAVMLPPITILAVKAYHKKHNLNFKYASFLSLFFAVGNFGGSKIALALPQNTLRLVFGSIIFLIALKMILK